jgi:thymidylate synthase ThyX
MISAEIICDSVSEKGHRLTTFQLRYPKFIHGELMTHRLFSRNASSSRAVPVSKSLQEVRSKLQRAVPVFWGKNQKGMQAAEELTGEDRGIIEAMWDRAARQAADTAELMADIGAHKQLVNRILEPFLHINVVVTATEFMNFFGLRLDKMAQPEMRRLAELMWTAYSLSKPKELKPGEWHLPYVDPMIKFITKDVNDQLPMIKVAVARIARVSYTSFETGRPSTIEEDIFLYERLFTSKHLSPFEHVATPDTNVKLLDIPSADYLSRRTEWTGDYAREWGNFIGWRQHRKMILGEAVAPLPEEYR